ncbi:MAG: hypothetical protein ACKOBD_16960 [Chloroflexota bacterium]|jgi:hypothetical protein
MLFSYEIDAELGLIIFIMTGDITLNQLVDLEQATFNDPARRPNMKIIADMRLASLDVDMDSIKRFLARNRELNRTGWELEMTAVVTHNRMLVTLAEAYELMGIDLPLKLRISDTLEDAVEWLQLSEVKDHVLAIRQHLLERITPKP